VCVPVDSNAAKARCCEDSSSVGVIFCVRRGRRAGYEDRVVGRSRHSEELRRRSAIRRSPVVQLNFELSGNASVVRVRARQSHGHQPPLPKCRLRVHVVRTLVDRSPKPIRAAPPTLV